MIRICGESFLLPDRSHHWTKVHRVVFFFSHINFVSFDLVFVNKYIYSGVLGILNLSKTDEGRAPTVQSLFSRNLVAYR